MKSNLTLIGKNALVCGASKGIGRACALALASHGANVTLVARTAALLDQSMKDLSREYGQNHDFLAADFDNSDDLQQKIRNLSFVRDYHIIVNNTAGPKSGLLHEATPDQLIHTFQRHVISAQIILQALLEGLKRNQYGRIINIISTSVKEPIEGLGVSNTIRGAMGNWAKTLANELGPFGITVNNVLPGFTETDRLQEIIQNKSQKLSQPEEFIKEQMWKEVPLRRFAQPSEIAEVVAFLASPKAAYINGINIPVDGGRTRSL